MRLVKAGGRAILLTAVAVVGGLAVVAAALWPVIGPVTQRTTLPRAALATDAGVPVPRSADRCAVQDPAAAGSVRWCMPPGVSVTTLTRWYEDVLPAGRDAGPLRWCVEQRLADGSRRALWSSPEGLVGYALPPQRMRAPAAALDDNVAVQVVTMPGTGCHPAARASREQA